ncbi:MAG: asparaginase domain-containing protein [Cellvibrionaceae bacterium]
MITLFTTGGTFDKVYFDAKSEFSVGDPQVEPILKDANVDIDYTITPLLRKDSLDMTSEDRQLICQSVSTIDSQQVIITHGTDGMVATAQALAEYGVEGKTIVLVGAMQPARMRVSDAPFNLGFTLAAVQILEPGIFITMNGRIFSHDNVVKNWEKGRFEAVS